MNGKFFFLGLFLASMTLPAAQAQTKITVDVDKPGHAVSPTLFGVFFEDINLSADGGLYPEMIRNRSFEDADTLQNWTFSSPEDKSNARIGNAEIYSKPPVPSLNPFNRKFLTVVAAGSFKLMTSGYWGINMVQGEGYTLKLAARCLDGFASPLKIRILDAKGNELATSEIKGMTENWAYFTVNLKANASDDNAKLEISGNGTGKLFLDMVSLMPDKTWKNHGLRTDLAEALDALQPKFLRFPGGCWVEGNEMKQMNRWKSTIGNIDTRTSLWNFWGYNATNGLGFHEYLQLAEDLGAEPLYCINVGMSHSETVPMDQMGQWVQDALDALEYANGPTTSVWGSFRAKNGHPEPFGLKYMEIGNENGGAAYNERWPLFVKAIQAKYPYVKLIANEWAGGHPSEPKPDLIDEHYYNTPDWFISNSNKYDQYDRNGAKIFVGEYAVTSENGKGNLRGAIGEAAWMIGMERNSDIVAMSAYAPLFCNTKHKVWPINLINFDNHRWYGLPSYYVQELFASNQGTKVLPVEITGNQAIEATQSKDGKNISDKNMSVKSLIVSAVKDDKSGDVILKVVNASSKAIRTEIDLKNAKAVAGKGKAVVLTSASPLDENTLDNPMKVSPKTEEVTFSGARCKRNFPGNSLTIIRCKTNNIK